MAYGRAIHFNYVTLRDRIKGATIDKIRNLFYNESMGVKICLDGSLKSFCAKGEEEMSSIIDKKVYERLHKSASERVETRKKLMQGRLKGVKR